jgi:plasmid stabilization system protein ParE
MTYRVIALRRAQADLWHFLEWLHGHSPQGAEHWYEAYYATLDKLADSPKGYPLIDEHPELSYPIHQCLFGTPRGRRYRLLLVVVGQEVRLLRIRGPGQPSVTWDDLV